MAGLKKGMARVADMLKKAADADSAEKPADNTAHVLARTAQKLNTDTSVVDLLKSKGRDSSFGSRREMAKTMGVENYKGTAKQNIGLLQRLKSESEPGSDAAGGEELNTAASPVTTTTTAAAPKKSMQRKPSPLDDVYSEVLSHPRILRNVPDATYNGYRSEIRRRVREFSNNNTPFTIQDFPTYEDWRQSEGY